MRIKMKSRRIVIFLAVVCLLVGRVRGNCAEANLYEMQAYGLYMQLLERYDLSSGADKRVLRQMIAHQCFRYWLYVQRGLVDSSNRVEQAVIHGFEALYYGPYRVEFESFNERADIPRAGRNLLLVARVGGELEFFVFDGRAKLILEASERTIVGKESEIIRMKSDFARNERPYSRNPAERAKISMEIASILGYEAVAAEIQLGKDVFSDPLQWRLGDSHPSMPLRVSMTYSEYKKDTEKFVSWLKSRSLEKSEHWKAEFTRTRVAAIAREFGRYLEEMRGFPAMIHKPESPDHSKQLFEKLFRDDENFRKLFLEYFHRDGGFRDFWERKLIFRFVLKDKTVKELVVISMGRNGQNDNGEGDDIVKKVSLQPNRVKPRIFFFEPNLINPSDN
jgi:hypothetical protein